MMIPFSGIFEREARVSSLQRSGEAQAGTRRDHDSQRSSMIQAIRGLLHRTLPLFLIAALTLSGCAGHKPSVPPAFYDSPGAALRALAASSPGAQALTATTRIAINRHGERYPLKVAVMMQRPAFLRVESIPLMGPPDFYLSIAEGELRVFLPGKGAFYTGRATPQNISRFFSVSMPAADMVSLLMGVPPDGDEEMQSRGGEREDGLYRVDQYLSGRKTRSLWIDPTGGRLIRFRRFTEEGTVVYTADFADHVRIGEVFLPQQLTIREEEISVLTFRHADLRQIAVDPGSFPLPAPDGITPILLDP
jgi:hypothetical protein